MARDETKFIARDHEGVPSEFTIVEFVTIDDVMEVAMKGAAAQIKFGTPYSSPHDKGTRDFLIRTHVTTGD